MSLYNMLKTAADRIEQMADAAEASQKRAEEAEEAAKAAQSTQQADDEEQKKTAAANIEIGRLAKQAAADLKEAGLISSDEQADVFASQCLDHSITLQKLSQFAGCVPKQKLGSVVVDDSVVSEEAPSADDAWTKRAQDALTRLGLNS